jgi:peptide/nickel transport system permease protein
VKEVKLGRNLLIKAFSLLMVVVVTLLLMNVVLGATGFSDRMLNALVNEQVRVYRQGLAQTIQDPNELQRIVDNYEQTLIQAYDLDKPWPMRLPQMIWRVMTFDLGKAKTSQTFKGSTEIRDLIMERLPKSILLITTSVGISALLGLVVGTKIATMPGSKIDRFFSNYSAFSYAIPTWWTGLLFIMIFAQQLRILPASGMYSAPPPTETIPRFIDLLWHAILPISTLVLAFSGSWIYMTRTMVLNTAQQDFVNVARAKGLPENLVMRRYIIRVAAPPILTNVILGLASSLSGAILTETVFGWPGMGLLYWNAIIHVDEGLIIALTFIYTLIYVIARMILEVLYVILDPRVEY